MTSVSNKRRHIW